MWQLQKAQAINFMSFENVEFDFQNKCYIIVGQNMSDGGQKSNGSGKSSFIDIIAIGLLGYSLTGRNVKDCIGWHSDVNYFNVKLTLVNKIHNLVCDIERTIYSNTKSAELVILVNGEVPNIPSKKGVKNGVDIREGNKYILKEILDIAEDDLLNYFLISKKSYNPFLAVNTDKKLEVIGRFTNTKPVDDAIAYLETEQETVNDGLAEYQTKIDTASGYIEALNNSLGEDKQAAFEKTKKATIEAIQADMERVEDDILDLDDNVAALQENRDAIVLHEIDEAKINELAEIISSLEEDLRFKTNALNDKHVQLANIENHLAGLIVCPNCSHEFSLSSEYQYTEKDKENLLQQIEEMRIDASNVQISISSTEMDLDIIVRNQNENKNLTREIASIERSITSTRQQQERLIDEYNRLQEKLATEQARTFQDQKADIAEQVREKEVEIENHKLEIENLGVELDRQNKWIGHFENFKFFLGNKPLQIICSLVNQYLKVAGSDLNLQIEGWKKLRSGELRQSLEPIIYRSWMNPQGYLQFSEGERVRLNVSTDLAFQQLINSASKYGGLNLYANDELISGLDSIGVQNAAKAFNSLDKTLLLVTHSGSDMVYDNTITIKKENNKSIIL